MSEESRRVLEADSFNPEEWINLTPQLARQVEALEAERVTKRDEIMRAVCEMDDASEYSHRLINVDYDALYETVSEILEPPE